jgi:ABC-type glycerol-3-phosphate transport system substrate-binding protein
MEEKYNFVIKEISMGSGALDGALRKSVQGGDDAYDLAIPLTNAAPSHAQNGLLIDLNKVANLNFDNPWWNNSVSHYFSMNNRLFFTTSDFILTPADNVSIMMYNKKLAESLGITGAEALYKLVDEGKWTFDVFEELCKQGWADLNGNGVVDGTEDRFGLVTCGWLYIAMLGGFNETLVAKDANDMPYFSCGTERFLSAYIKMTEFMLERQVVVREGTDFPGRTEEVFVNDRALFCGQVLSCVRLYKDMGSDFGILPMPKLDENQEKYSTYSLWSSCIAIPSTNPDIERTGHILEALSAESRKLVIPAYYEVSIGTKYLRDEGSVRMLDIILDNRIYDIGDSMYNWGGFTGAVSTMAQRGDLNFASAIEKYKERVETAIQKTVDAYELVD